MKVILYNKDAGCPTTNGLLIGWREGMGRDTWQTGLRLLRAEGRHTDKRTWPSSTAALTGVESTENSM